MVIVVGSPVLLGESIRPGRRAGGLAVGIALAAAEAGARVELVGKVGDDAAGDMIAVELERAGVGHAALLRDPSAATPSVAKDQALPLARQDVELALRYLVDFRVIVAADPVSDPVAEAVAEAAHYGGAHLVVIGGEGAAVDGAVSNLRAPRGDEGPFATFVGRYAAHLDAGRDPGDAFTTAVSDVGWEPARD